MKNKKFNKFFLSILIICISGFINVKAENQDLLQNQTKVTGKVMDISGEVLIGVNVMETGTLNGTVTDINGMYTLIPSTVNPVLSFTYVGFKEKAVRVDNKSIIDIVLEEDVEALDEVVVIGYGTTKKSDLTGSVSSVSEKYFNKGISVSPEQLIAGKVSGVQIVQSSGEPGGGINVSIRGMGSLNAGNSPLYVIDGYPIDNSATVTGTGANFTGMRTSRNPLNSINPNDIASIEVLKDASAAAIYGSRGANGVILITTKRGTSGALKVNYDSYFGVQNVMNDLKLLNAEEYKNVINSLIDAGEGREELKINNFDNGTNWLKEVYVNNAPIQNHNLSFSGGNENTKYHTSLNYLNQQGILINSRNQRYTARLNLENSYKDFKMGFNISSSYIKDNYVANGMDLNERAGVIYAAVSYEPTLPIYDENGKYSLSSNMNIDNPLAIANGKTSISDLYRTYGTVFGQYNFLNDYTLKINLGADLTSQRRDTYVGRKTIEGRSNGGIASILSGIDQSFLAEITLNYKKKFKNQNIDALIGTTSQQFNYLDENSQASGFPSDATLTDNMSLADPSTYIVGSSKTRNSLLSYLGRINYNINNKYLLTTSLRIDGSSRFGENNKYGVFPSFAFAYRLENEKFIQDMNVFDALKLRTSWGRTGNQEIGNYRSLTTYSTGWLAVIDDKQISTTTPSRLANPNLKWETSEQLNIGLDFGFVKNRITGSFDWFVKNTKDMLLNLPIPRTTGYNTMMTNVGSVKNSGYEVLLNSYNLTGEFSWETTLNLSWQDNEVTNLGNIDAIYSGSAGSTSNISIIQEGLPMYSFYGYIIDGIWQTGDDFSTILDDVKPGDFKYRDVNGDKIVDTNDREVLGSPFPNFTPSITNNFNYKGFNLNIFVDGAFGAKMLNNNLVDTYFPANFMRNRIAEPLLNRWTEINPSAIYPSFLNTARQGNKRVNSYTVEGTDFLRLNTVKLGYTFNLNNSFIEGLEIYVTGQNLFIWTKYKGYDPSINPNGQGLRIDWNAYPTARTILFGINLNI